MMTTTTTTTTTAEDLIKQMQQTRNTLEKLQQEEIKRFLEILLEILLSPEQYNKVKDTVDADTVILLPITLYNDLNLKENPIHFIQGSSLLTNQIMVTKKMVTNKSKVINYVSEQ